jgi:hypothetical protein
LWGRFATCSGFLTRWTIANKTGAPVKNRARRIQSCPTEQQNRNQEFAGPGPGPASQVIIQIQRRAEVPAADQGVISSVGIPPAPYRFVIIRLILAISGMLFLGSVGAFLLFVSALSIAAVVFILMGLLLMFGLGIQVGARNTLSPQIFGKKTTP